MRQPLDHRRRILDLDLAGCSDDRARATIWAAHGAAMHESTQALQAEGTVSKRLDSLYRPGRSSHWLKTNHTIIDTLQVVGWRSSTPSQPGGLILAESGEPIGVATLFPPPHLSTGLVDLLERYGWRHPTGTITIPEDRIEAKVNYTSRTPTHGRLREASSPPSNPAPPSTSQPMARRPDGPPPRQSSLPIASPSCAISPPAAPSKRCQQRPRPVVPGIEAS